MKRYYLGGLICLLFSLFTYQSSFALVFKWIRVNNYWTEVFDINSQCEAVAHQRAGYSYYNDFSRQIWNGSSWSLGTKDWTDENGKIWPVKISNAPQVSYNEETNTMPVPDKNGITLHRYFRYQPPSIMVDGFRLDEPFPMDGDEVNPDKIPGTADVMLENWLNTSMGLTVHRRVYGWTQKNHDDYLIFDMTFINTGNVDLDDEIELPDQTLKDVYYYRSFRASDARDNWYSSYGEYPSDSLRLSYSYPGRGQTSDYDNTGIHGVNALVGGVSQSIDDLLPIFLGETTLYCDKSASEHVDDPAQPQMTGNHNTEQPWNRDDASISSPDQQTLLYDIMQKGLIDFAGTPYMEGTYPGTHHSVRQEDLGYEFTRECPWWQYGTVSVNSWGPFTIGPGDSIRIVYADEVATISREKGYEVYKAWKDGTCEPPAGFVLGTNDNMPPPYKKYPALYAADSRSTEYNNWARDCWTFTGKDSLFQNSANALWNFQHGYNVPIAPPPPSIEVKSLPDRITISWGSESESASDFAGYRLYRAKGNPAPIVQDNTLVGLWHPIFECGAGTANALTHTYDDLDAKRGQAYYYYLAAFDNGTDNIADVDGQGKSIESGKYLNRTTRAAHLARAAGTLSTARVVPNPFNIGAGPLQYSGEPNKIMFMDLPPKCTIRIFSESGDLVKTLEHTSGSGDEPWGDIAEEQSVTGSGQLIVSGIYIAHIETPDGQSANLKFLVVR